MKLQSIAGRPVILFDLDGTLLPMDMKKFEQAYFQGLCRSLPEFQPEELIRLVWSGTGPWCRNDRFPDQPAKPSRKLFRGRAAWIISLTRSAF